MPLNKGALQSGLAGMGFDAAKAAELATIIDDYVKGAQVNPTAMVAPPSGGPVTGTGTLS
jgi:hypothetical protein